MAPLEKLYPKYDLLQTYDEPIDALDRVAGSFRYKVCKNMQIPLHPSTARVFAATQVLFCEQLRIAVVIHRAAIVPSDAIVALPEGHPLLQNREESLTINGVYRSDLIAADIAKRSKAWMQEVAANIPTEIMLDPDIIQRDLPQMKSREMEAREMEARE